MSALKLTLFGPPRLEREGRPVEVSRRKSLAMLAYLAATGQPHSRDTLASLFWPEVPQRRARGNLRRALSDLNQEIGEGILVLEGETVALAGDNGLCSDVAQFRACLAVCAGHDHSPEETCPDCLSLLTEAANLYQADFLAGFTLRDAPEFDDWQYFEAEGRRQELASVLERLVQGHSARRDYEAAIPYARRWVALDNLNEPVQRELMHLYALAGRRHEALRQYKVCVEALETELGASPDPETEALYRQIVGGDVAPAPTVTPKPAWLPPAPIAVAVERSAPLVGREAELETVQAKINSGWHGQGGTILLAGVSGLGKTRLAYEALRNAAQSGMTTLVGAAYEQEGHLAYHPFIEALDRYLSEQRRPPEENPITHYKPMGATDLQQENTALFKAAASFLTRLTASSPVVLLLDDLHAADEASLSMFHYLARQTQTAPVILLATYRTDITLDVVSPFGSLLNALYRKGLSDTFHLMPLSETAGAEIVNHTLAGQAEPALVKAVLDGAEGNPFYVQEITRAMLKADHVIHEEGQWRLLPGTTLQIPTGLQELLRARVQRLGPTIESALTAAAVVGREFRFAVLQRITELPDGDLLDALDAALATHLLEETNNGYRFQHSLIRHTLYDALSRRRRAWLHTRTGEAIEATFTGRPEGLVPHVEALAYHYDLSDRRDKALPYLRQAAHKAADLFALEVANDYLERALALMDELGVNDPAQRWSILEQLGTLARVLADTSRAVARYEQALALPFPLNSERSEGGWQPGPGDRVRLHRSAARSLITAGRAVESERHLQTAMGIMAGTGQASLDYANLLYDVALWHWHNNEHQEAFETAQRSLDIAERLNDVTARAQAYEMLALACHSLGEWQQGLNFEQQRSMLIGPNLDVTEAFDAHL